MQSSEDKTTEEDAEQVKTTYFNGKCLELET